MSTSTDYPTAVDGDDVLKAVMSFLDDHDAFSSLGQTAPAGAASSPPPSDYDGDASDHSPMVSSDDTSPAKKKKSTTTTNEPPHRGVVRSDKRQREEMLALREESLALQDELTELKNKFMQSHEGPSPAKKRAEEQKGDMDLRRLRAHAWQAVSEVQQKRREAAEQERDRLRELIKQQKLAYRGIRRYMARHAAKTEHAAAEVGSAHTDEEDDASTDACSGSDDAEFEEISRAIPSMLLQTGALFKDERLDSVISGLRDLKVQNEQTPRMSVEALESRVVPFDVTTTANAVWMYHITKAHCRSPDVDQSADQSQNSVRRTFIATVEQDDTKLLTKGRGRMEIRRFIEGSRVVIVKSSILDRIEVGGITIPEYEIREYQWTIIGPPRLALLRDSGKTVAQVEVFGVSIPTNPELGGVDDRTLRRAIQVGCVDAVKFQLNFERRSVENILMKTMAASASLSREMLQLPQW